MTPAVRTLETLGLPFELLSYEPASHTTIPGNTREARLPIGLSAARALGVDPSLVFKTLIAELNDGRLVVGIVPVEAKLNLKALARAAGARSALLAERMKAERATGYVTGGISPIGQRRALPTYLDSQARELPVIHVSAGKRGLELALSPAALIKASAAVVAALTD